MAAAASQLVDGRISEVGEEARERAEREPVSSIAQTQAAAAYIGSGEIDYAVPLLERALELDPTMPMALYWLGVCRTVQGRLAEAERLVRAAIEAGLRAAWGTSRSPWYAPANSRRPASRPCARPSVDRGPRLAADLALAHASLGDEGVP